MSKSVEEWFRALEAELSQDPLAQEFGGLELPVVEAVVQAQEAAATTPTFAEEITDDRALFARLFEHAGNAIEQKVRSMVHSSETDREVQQAQEPATTTPTFAEEITDDRALFARLFEHAGNAIEQKMNPTQDLERE